MVAPVGVGVRRLPLPFTALSKAVLQLPGGARGGRLQRRKRKGVESILHCSAPSFRVAMLLTAVMS